MEQIAFGIQDDCVNFKRVVRVRRQSLTTNFGNRLTGCGFWNRAHSNVCCISARADLLPNFVMRGFAKF